MSPLKTPVYNERFGDHITLYQTLTDDLTETVKGERLRVEMCSPVTIVSLNG